MKPPPPGHEHRLFRAPTFDPGGAPGGDHPLQRGERPLLEQAVEELGSAVGLPQAEEVLALVQVIAVHRGERGIEVVHAVPVDPLRRGPQEVEEHLGLLELVVLPGGETRLRDPDLAGAVPLVEDLPHHGYVALPPLPGVVEDIRKTVDPHHVYVIHHPQLEHPAEPVPVDGTHPSEDRLLAALFGPVGRPPDHLAEGGPVRVQGPVPLAQVVRLVPELDVLEVLAERGDEEVDEIGVILGMARGGRGLGLDPDGGGGVQHAREQLHLLRQPRDEPVVPPLPLAGVPVRPGDPGPEAFGADRLHVGEDPLHPFPLARPEPLHDAEGSRSYFTGRPFHSVNPRWVSSACASETRSMATSPSSHPASSASPSSKETLGAYPRTERAELMSAKQCLMSPAR